MGIEQAHLDGRASDVDPQKTRRLCHAFTPVYRAVRDKCIIGPHRPLVKPSCSFIELIGPGGATRYNAWATRHSASPRMEEEIG